MIHWSLFCKKNLITMHVVLIHYSTNLIILIRVYMNFWKKIPWFDRISIVIQTLSEISVFRNLLKKTLSLSKYIYFWIQSILIDTQKWKTTTHDCLCLTKHCNNTAFMNTRVFLKCFEYFKRVVVLIQLGYNNNRFNHSQRRCRSRLFWNFLKWTTAHECT